MTVANKFLCHLFTDGNVRAYIVKDPTLDAWLVTDFEVNNPNKLFNPKNLIDTVAALNSNSDVYFSLVGNRPNWLKNHSEYCREINGKPVYKFINHNYKPS
jgi:hypothetical protein